MSSDRSKKILKNALVPRRLMFDIEPDSDAVQDSDVIEDSDTERPYAIPQCVEMSTHIQQIEQFDEEITNLETEIENIEILHENNSGNVNNVGSALKVRSKRIIKKSYADYLSDNGDFEWSSSSWVGSSDDECSDEETSRKKQKTDALEDGKVGNNGYKKKKKTNTKKERKQLRNEGKEYTKKDGTVARAKVMKSHPCLSKKCGRSCHEISDERRQSLFDYFHGLSKERKRDWLVSNSQIENTKRKRTKDACSRRQYSFLYFINDYYYYYHYYYLLIRQAVACN